MLICSRALGVAFSRPSELLSAVSLPWRRPMLHPLWSGSVSMPRAVLPRLGPEVAEHLFETSEAATDLDGQQFLGQVVRKQAEFDRNWSPARCGGP